MSELKIPDNVNTDDNSVFIKIMTFEEISILVKEYPNDQELGAKIRKIINETNEKIKKEKES